ncbi:MAG: hypothetical protein JXB50_03390 [Spirochaetes bacterium]|nr:hypothetical protein [Spirochaetota bacterium]
MEDSTNISKIAFEFLTRSIIIIPFLIVLIGTIIGYLKNKTFYFLLMIIGTALIILINLFSLLFLGFIQTDYLNSFITITSFLTFIGNLIFGIGFLLTILFSKNVKKADDKKTVIK